jgi:hypothetical protein
MGFHPRDTFDDAEKSKAAELVGQGWQAARRLSYSDASRRVESHWERVERLIAGQTVDNDEIDEFQEFLEISVFGDPPLYMEPRNDVDSDDERVKILLDSLQALAISDATDPAPLWSRGVILSSIGRHLEAASDFIAAAHRFAERAGTSQAVTDDEDDWSESALAHAARNLVLAGHFLSAARLLERLAPEDEAQIRSLLHEEYEARS